MDLGQRVAEGLAIWRELSTEGMVELREGLSNISNEIEAEIVRGLVDEFDCMDLERLLGITNEGLLASLHLSIEKEKDGFYLYPNFHFYQLEKFDIVGECERVGEMLKEKSVIDFIEAYGEYTNFKEAVQIEVERNQSESFLNLGLESHDYNSLEYILDFKERLPELTYDNINISYTGTMGYVDDSDYIVSVVYNDIIGEGDSKGVRKNLTVDDLLVLREIWDIPQFYQGFKNLITHLI